MTYTPYLIANYSTGLEKRLQPWLLPDDAQQELYDGFVYRGVLGKRDGYNYFATGELPGPGPYRESRIVHTLTAVPAAQAANGILVTFTLAGTGPIARGSVTVNGSNPVVVGTDNGLGLIGSITGTGIVSGTVNYTTGAISVTFTVAPVNLSTVTFTYSFMADKPVMMIASFYTSSNIRELIVASTVYINRYNSTLNILQDITATPYTGNSHQFFTWTNYASATEVPRLIFANNKDPIQQYDGSVVTNYAYNMLTTPTIAVPVPVAVNTLTCLLMADFKDRLLLFRTTENGVIYPRRIRISGTGINSDDFRTSATGAGVIDIPDNTWIFGIAFNRDDLIIFTESSTWVLKYTGNDTTPFVLNKIDESRGSQAPFAAITYLNRTSAASPRALIMTDGYRVERQDDAIPDFSFNEVDGANFDLCFAGSVDADKDHYLIYPPPDQDESKRILTTNYDEDNYSIYRLPLSCMGTYVTAFDITWNDLLKYDNWFQFEAAYGNWNSFAYTAGAPFSIGGGHHGEIWRLAVSESEDNPVRIYNITQPTPELLEITTDWNNYGLNNYDPEMGSDYIFFTGIEGMLELNGKQFPIDGPFISNNVFRVKIDPAVTYSAYTGSGTASRVIPFSALFKAFNPYADQDKKVRCGWLYMYVDSTGTDLTRNLAIANITKALPAVVTTQLNHNLTTGNSVAFFSVGGMTELDSIEGIVTVLTPTTFAINGVDSTGFTAYTSGGYVTTPDSAKMVIDIITNSRNPEQISQLNNPATYPYQGNCTNMTFQDGAKKWYKVFINQTGTFIQFRLRNTQAGSNIRVQATMPGFQPLGRLI